MKNIFISIILLLFCINLNAQSELTKAKSILENKGEVKILVDTKNNSLTSLSRIVCLAKKTSDSTWLAFANKKQLDRVVDSNIQFKVFNENTLKSILVATDTSQMSSWNRYPTYSTYLTMMKSFANNYPNICRLDTIGYTVNNRLLLCLIISNNPNVNQDKPKFFYSSSIHGNELTGAMLLLHLVDYILKNQTNSEVSQVLNNIQLYVCPLANPDGTYSGGNNDVSQATRYNANYVDINRNFPDFVQGTHPDGEQTQIETQAFINYATNNKFNMSCNLHTGSEVFNYPFDCYTSSTKTHADKSWFNNLGNAFVDSISSSAPSSYFTSVNNSGIVDGGDWYVVYGGRQDYHTYFLHCREVTVEVSDDFMPQSSNLPNYWTYLKSSLFTFLSWCNKGFDGVCYDSLTNERLYDVKIEIINHDRDNSEVYSNNNGYYFRPIENGTYNVSFSKQGYLSKTMTINYSNSNMLHQNVFLTKASSNNTISKTNNDVFIYPTLCKNTLNIKTYCKSKYEIFDLQGRKIIKGNLNNNDNIIDLSNLNKGQYIIKVINADKQYTKQISVIK
ncbi:MAG: T9SS type A sorting domain-containing protein [Bacteroidales bacterium]|jgi:hypothetical protein|nr:T9SS type A sorting domain-containing protein [Bacteroidales bacterium]